LSSARATTKILLGALALSSVTCTTFPDVSTVLDLRVLAVQTDPPDVFLQVTGLPSDPAAPIDPQALGIDAASIRAIHVAPLIANPAGGLVTWDLSACPNNPYGRTPPGGVMGGGATDPGGGANDTVGSTLCDESPIAWSLAQNVALDEQPPFTFTPAPGDLLTAFMHDIYLDQLGQPHGGFDLGMPLNLQLTVHQLGAPDVKAVKRVVFWAQHWPDQTLNSIPTIPSVSVFGDRDPGSFTLLDAAGTLDATTPTHVALGSGKGLWLLPEYHEYDPQAPAGTIPTDEPYHPTVIDRDPPYQAVEGVPAVERIRYAFYATAGHFDPPRSVNQLVPGTVGTIHLESHFVPPATIDGVPVDAASGLHLVTIWIVVRDDRGGESWIEGHLALDQ
jgi:hypothetical protein